MHVLEVIGRRLRDRDAGLARAGERDDRNVGMAHERLAGLLAEAVHDLHDVVRQARVVEQVDEPLREQRRVLRRLQHDGVATDQRGTELPRGDRDREVPRRDRADHTDRHAQAEHRLVAQLRRGRLAEQPPALAAHVVGHVDRLLHVAAGLGLHLPHLARHQLRELGLRALELLREAEQDVAALRRGHEAPLLPGRLRGGNGAVDVRRARARERLDDLARRGFSDSKVAAAIAARTLAGRVGPGELARDPLTAAVARLPLAAVGLAVPPVGTSRRSTMTVTFGLSL